jgi:hypothetical protein
MSEQSSGNGVGGSYMKAFLPGLMVGLIVGGFSAAYLVPMLSSPGTTEAHPGPRPGAAAPVVEDKDRVQERPDRVGEAQPDDAKSDDTGPDDVKTGAKPEDKTSAKPADKPVEPPK